MGDPFENRYLSVTSAIKKGINATYEVEAYASAVILVYAAIDSIAALTMPAEQLDVKDSDFINWCDRYIAFPCTEQISGEELYGARCSTLHRFGSESRRSRTGKCRQIGYMVGRCPPVEVGHPKNKHVVMLSVRALIYQFCNGIDSYLKDILADQNKLDLATPRMDKLFDCYSFVFFH